LRSGTGIVFIKGRGEERKFYSLIYIDRDGNIAQVDIDPELIDEKISMAGALSKEVIGGEVIHLDAKLRDLGFNIVEFIDKEINRHPKVDISWKILNEIIYYERRQAEKLWEEKQKGFSF